jgi:hypothetical protein
VPVEAPPRPKRETWRDWAPDAPEPGELLTRDELLGRLAAEGEPTTGNQLRYWQAVGLIPFPTKRRQPGGTAVHAQYPPWVTELVRALRDHRGVGDHLPATRAHLRALAPRLAAGGRYGGYREALFPPHQTRQLAEIAAAWQPTIRRPIVRVDLRLTDDLGREYEFGTPVPANGRSP